MSEIKKSLIIIFKEKISFSIIEDEPPNEIVINGNTFKNIDDTFVLGFYDWLRTHEGKVVGVRLYPFPDSYFPFFQFINLPKIIVIENYKIETYFFEEFYFNDEKSADQSFSSSKI